MILALNDDAEKPQTPENKNKTEVIIITLNDLLIFIFLSKKYLQKR